LYNDNIYVTNYIHLNIKQSIINKSYSIKYNADNRDKWFFD